MDGKHFENGALRKRFSCDVPDRVLPKHKSKLTDIVAFSNFTGVVWTGPQMFDKQAKKFHPWWRITTSVFDWWFLAREKFRNQPTPTQRHCTDLNLVPRAFSLPLETRLHWSLKSYVFSGPVSSRSSERPVPTVINSSLLEFIMLVLAFKTCRARQWSTGVCKRWSESRHWTMAQKQENRL